MPFANYPNLNGNHRIERHGKLNLIDEVPKQYAKPYRKTGYLHAHPHSINGGLLYKNHEIYENVFQYNHQQDHGLMNLFRDNELSFSADRVKDARGFGWYDEPHHGITYDGRPPSERQLRDAHTVDFTVE